MVNWSHYLDPADVSRGYHIYSLRGLSFHQHHGIVISGGDANRLDPKPPIIETFMVVEQNKTGLNVVTLAQFAHENHGLISGKRCIRRALYSENPFTHGIKRRGSCYIEPTLPDDMVVENAVLIYNDPTERSNWSTYSVSKRNCEHFAFKCCTDISVLSEQVLAKHVLLHDVISTTAMTATPLI